MASKAIFLDRDDTLIEDTGYTSSPDQVKLLDGVGQALNEFKKMGYKLIIVSNQSGIARGIFTEETLQEIHNRLEHLLKQQGVYLDKIYYCPYLADGVVEKYRKESEDRKPNPGMILKASKELDIDLGNSWMIGDGERDVQAGKNAGCKTILIRPSSQTIGFAKTNTVADHVAVNIREAVNIVKKFKYVFKKPLPEPETTEQKSAPAAPSKHVPAPQTKKKITNKEFATLFDETEPAVTQNLEQQVTVALPSEPELESNGTQTMTQQTKKISPLENQPDSDTAGILNEILNELKALRRKDMFGDFSIMRLIAGTVQVIVLLCLLISIWILMNPASQGSNSVLITLAFAGVLQMMALTFYIMQGPK